MSIREMQDILMGVKVEVSEAPKIITVINALGALGENLKKEDEEAIE